MIIELKTTNGIVPIQGDNIKQTDAPRHNSATGYGNKIPTSYMVRYLKKWRRVYAICYSNAATLYILVKGDRVFLDDYNN